MQANEHKIDIKINVALLIRKRMIDDVDIKEYVREVTTYISHINQLYIYNMTGQDLSPFYSLLTKYDNISYTNCSDYGEAYDYEIAYENLKKAGADYGVVLELGYYYEEETFLALKRYLIEHATKDKIAVLTAMPLRGCEMHMRQAEDSRACMGCNLVGTLVDLNIFSLLKGLKLEYYQTTFDYEYCLKARANGYKVILLQNYVFRNNNYKVLEKKFWFLKLTTFDYDLMDIYYQTRNRFYLWDEYEKIDPKYVKLDKKLYRGERHMMKVRDKNYHDKFYMMEEAHFDYLRGIKGKYKGGNENEKNN